MLKQFLSLILLTTLTISCNEKEQKKENVLVEKTNMNIQKKHSTPSKLSAISTKEMKNWKEYNELNSFIGKFENTSPSKALANILDLKDISKKFKDTIRVNDLKTSAFRARLNVFNNEVLRLADMSYIGAITAEEVNEQVGKIVLIYSSINDKINAVYAKKEFDKTINLDNFFVLDSVKKTTPKKTEKLQPKPDFRKTKLQTLKTDKLQMKKMEKR